MQCVQLRGGAEGDPLTPDQGLCPWTPLGALLTDSRYRFALRTHRVRPPQLWPWTRQCFNVLDGMLRDGQHV